MLTVLRDGRMQDRYEAMEAGGIRELFRFAFWWGGRRSKVPCKCGKFGLAGD